MTVPKVLEDFALRLQERFADFSFPLSGHSSAIVLAVFHDERDRSQIVRR